MWVDHTHDVLTALAEVEASLTRAESTARAFFVARDASRISEFEEARDRTMKAARRLRDLVADNSSQQSMVGQLTGTVDSRLALLQRNMRLFDGGSSIESLTTNSGSEGRRLAADANARIAELRREEQELLARRIEARHKTNGALIWLCGSVMLVGIVVAFRGNQMIRRYRDLRDKAEEQLREANEQLEIRVRERTKELERSNNDLRQFTYAASHDLNEPLRTISIYSDFLKQRHLEKLDQNAAEVLGFILKGVSRMDALLRGLRAYLDVSTASNEAAPRIELRAAVDTALEDLEAALKECGGSVECGPLPRVRMHTVHARQLFQNLIGNSIKYRSRDPLAISVSSEQTGDLWTVRVRDNGIGIDPQYHDQIFGLFKRLHTMDDIPGSGLGLAICKSIVEQYGGTIWVESEAGKGCVFAFTVPAENR